MKFNNLKNYKWKVLKKYMESLKSSMNFLRT